MRASAAQALLGSAGSPAGLKISEKCVQSPGQHQAAAGGVILLGGDCSALGVARSLAPSGVKVWFLPGANPLARFSRNLKTIHGWPGAEDAGALPFLEQLATAGGYQGAVLLPAGDSEVRLVTMHHERLSRHFRLTTPPWEVTRFCADKQLTYALCAAQGLGHPHTQIVHDVDAARAAALRFPVVLKPAMKEGVNALTRAKMWVAKDEGELLARLDEALKLAGEGGLIVQELIPDDGANQFSYCAFAIEGEPRVVMAARRTRQRPRKAGTGTFVETLPPQSFEGEAASFLRLLRYTGLVEIEYMRDPRDGTFKLIDANPRIWTWHALGLPAGVNFAEAVWRHANRLDVPLQRAKEGHNWIYASRDITVAIREIAEGKLSLAGYLKQLTSASAYAAFDIKDPLPACADIPLSLVRRFRP